MNTYRPQRTDLVNRESRNPRPADDATRDRLREASEGLDQTRDPFCEACAARYDAYSRQKRSEAARRGWETRRSAKGADRATPAPQAAPLPAELDPAEVARRIMTEDMSDLAAKIMPVVFAHEAAQERVRARARRTGRPGTVGGAR